MSTSGSQKSPASLGQAVDNLWITRHSLQESSLRFTPKPLSKAPPPVERPAPPFKGEPGRSQRLKREPRIGIERSRKIPKTGPGRGPRNLSRNGGEAVAGTL
jgi:hypothetical protein